MSATESVTTATLRFTRMRGVLLSLHVVRFLADDLTVSARDAKHLGRLVDMNMHLRLARRAREHER